MLPGIGIAVGLSILNVFRRAWQPYETTLGLVDGPGRASTTSARTRTRSTLPGLVIYRFDAPLFFANAKTFRDEVMHLARAEPAPRWIVVAAEPITDVDTTAADVLLELDQWLDERGQTLVFAEMKDPVRRKIERYGLTADDRAEPLLPHRRRRRRRLPRAVRRAVDRAGTRRGARRPRGPTVAPPAPPEPEKSAPTSLG